MLKKNLSDNDSLFVPSNEEKSEGEESNVNEWITSNEEEAGNDEEDSDNEESTKISVEDTIAFGIGGEKE